MSHAQLSRDAETFETMAQQIRQVSGSFESVLGQKLALSIDERLRALESSCIECCDELRRKAK